MFCNKLNVNIITAHLLAAGIEDAVVCPGSRNAVIVHNFNECAKIAASKDNPTFRLHPVTDERSAAFVAIGLWLATRKPIAVCVTSGSALLNLLPGVAEAYYRHIPLILISADRPAEWIGQLDGQTIPQPDALLPYAKCWDIGDNMPEEQIHTLCKESLNAMKDNGGVPVHINVPLHEPLFDFSTTELPDVGSKHLHLQHTVNPEECASDLITPKLAKEICNAKHPAVIIGQWESEAIPAIEKLRKLGWTIFAENISNHGIFNDTIPEEGVDFLVHIGGALVEKQLKLQLRSLSELTIVRIDETDEMPKTFGHIDYKIQAHPSAALRKILELLPQKNKEHLPQKDKDVDSVHNEQINGINNIDISRKHKIVALFVGNSTAVRWTNHNLRLPVPTYCNRGVNGIEGSLSVAAGFSLQTQGNVLCVIGDLSFFYDANALWNQQLNSNLRILLINNKRGGIFYKLPHLTESPALDDYIAAQHESEAYGIAQSYHCSYLSAHSNDLTKDIHLLLERLLNEPSAHPVILEVTID